MENERFLFGASVQEHVGASWRLQVLRFQEVDGDNWHWHVPFPHAQSKVQSPDLAKRQHWKESRVLWITTSEPLHE